MKIIVHTNLSLNALIFSQVGDPRHAEKWIKIRNRHFNASGVSFKNVHLDKSTTQQSLLEAIEKLNSEDGISNIRTFWLK